MNTKKEVKRQIKKVFMKSLIEDNDKWTRETQGAAGYIWLEYKGPIHKDRTSFGCCSLTKNCGIYEDGWFRHRFKPNLIDRIKIKKYLKKIDKRYEYKYEEEIKKHIKHI